MGYDEPMNQSKDRELGMHCRITRRDFLNGAAVTIGAALTLPRWLSAIDAAADEPYPPALTGMRGSTNGTFEVAHQLRDGSFWEAAGAPIDTGEVYDVVIVGAGISGLSAAWFYRKLTGPKTRILLLDNHDDFGGHARRQEFTIDNRLLLTNGGTYAIESPAPYSKVAKGLIEELGINVAGFHNYLKADRYRSHNLSAGFFFDKATFGKDILLPDPNAEHYQGAPDVKETAWEKFLAGSPLNEKAKKDLYRLFKEAVDYLPGMTSAEKKARLARVSYAEYLTTLAHCDSSILPFFQTRPHPLYGVGIDAVPAQDAWGLDFPGFQGLKLDPEPGIGMNRDSIPNEEAEKYFFHFPDGNASIARMLVRKLVPAAIPGKTAEDIVLARARYGQLDSSGAATRIRLSSTVVRVKQDKKEVEITYARNGKAEVVRAAGCVMACWHTVIPYICPELPREQQTALAYAVKVPLVYARAAIRNWTSWEKLGVSSVHSPGNYFSQQHLSMPLSIGGYDISMRPEDPMVINLFRAPCSPGLPARQQHRAGRAELLSTSFETFERNIRSEMAAVLGAGGFDPARDITAIAVHRWPHGYAYQYNSLFDPFWLEGQEGPCAIARQPFGRITIANSDSEAYAYTDSAINEGHRAVQELLHPKS